jgi:hypothetical protein
MAADGQRGARTEVWTGNGSGSFKMRANADAMFSRSFPRVDEVRVDEVRRGEVRLAEVRLDEVRPGEVPPR